MKRRLTPTSLVFGVLGGLLLLDLVLPIANLFLHADWRGWMAALAQPGFAGRHRNFRLQPLAFRFRS
jgi:hypothetical protein